METIRGRRRPIPEIQSRILAMRQYAERTAINSVIQGSAADLIKIAMVNLHRRMQRDGTPVQRDLRWGVYVTFRAPTAYVQRCFREYGLSTDASGRYPRASMQALGRAGLLGLTIAPEHGGMGQGMQTVNGIGYEI